MPTPYDDIIHLPHHVSQNHPQMPLRDRAAPFSAFAALTGYEAVVDEVGRLTESRLELDEQEIAELNHRLNLLVSKLPEHSTVTITYFVPDERKSGGKYRTVTGAVKKISDADRLIVMEGGDTIPIESIAALDFPNSRED